MGEKIKEKKEGKIKGENLKNKIKTTKKFQINKEKKERKIRKIN